MKNKPIPEEQAYRNLDGSLIDLDTIDKSKLPNQNGYFWGTAFGVLGLILGLYGGLHYKVSDEEFYILLVLGSLMFFRVLHLLLKRLYIFWLGIRFYSRLIWQNVIYFVMSKFKNATIATIL